jgi:hypothetical protein
VLKLLESHRESIVAVISGHLHLTGHAAGRGLDQVVVSGLYSWPGDWARLDVYPDRIKVKMIAPGRFLPSPELDAMPMRNAAHDRHGREFTDADHPTFADYLRGRADERAFTLALAAPLRIDPDRPPPPLEPFLAQ